MSQPDWIPDWLRPHTANHRGTYGADATADPLAASAAAIPIDMVGTLHQESQKIIQQTNSSAPNAGTEWRKEPIIVIPEQVPEDRSVNRKLRGIHLFVSSSE